MKKLSRLLPIARVCLFGAAYLWPIDQPPVLTSTFGEFRSHHFHGGIDLSTSQRNDIPVRAIESGSVIRVRASGVGYGRAIYFLLNDGNTAVYAHLDAYAPDLAAWVAAVQESTGRYEQDLNPPKGRFRYSRGDTIAYTGQSGAGPSHLHVEIRRGDTGLNPLVHGLPTNDGLRPLIRALWIYPASPDSRVNGGFAPVRLTPRDRGNGKYYIGSSPVVSGSIRVALEAQDRAEGKATPLGLYEIGASLDDELFFLARMDSIPWGKTREVKVVFDSRIRSLGTRRVYALTPPDGLQTGVVLIGKNSLSESRGSRVLRVWCVDGNGNRSELEAPIWWDNEHQTLIKGARAARSRNVSGIDVEFYPETLVARFPGSPSGELVVTPSFSSAGEVDQRGSSGGVWQLPPGTRGPLTLAWIREVETGGREPAVPETLQVRHLQLGEVEPGWNHSVRSSDGNFEVRVGEDGAFERHPIALEVDEKGGARVDFGWGETQSALYRVLPAAMPLRGSAEITLELGSTQGGQVKHTGLFAVSGNSAYLVTGPPTGSTNKLSGKVRGFGNYIALSDTVAPTIQRGRVRNPKRDAGGTAVFEIRWSVRDRGSGIGTKSLTLWVDERRVPVEYDADASAAVWRPHIPPESGSYSYRLIVEDRLGNQTTRQGKFQRP